MASVKKVFEWLAKTLFSFQIQSNSVMTPSKEQIKIVSLCAMSVVKAIGEAEWSVLSFDRLITEERASRTNWVRGWVGPRAGRHAGLA
jgi:hypothetical protein